MPVFPFEGVTPSIHPDAWIAPTATIVGDVTIEAGASIWYNAVVRGDVAPVVIRSGANVQDCAVVHGPPGVPTEIGHRVTVGHLCMVHGATIEDDCLIGNAATVLDRARVGKGSLVAAHSMVGTGADIAPGSMAAGAPAVVKREIAGTPLESMVLGNGPYYAELATRHRKSLADS